MLSEEEIIKNIKEMIQWSDHNTYKMALQGLLDLYNKEKEKNEELSKNFNELYKTAHNDFEERCRLTFKLDECETRLQEEINEVCKLKTELYGNSISKDKIREKIKELDKKAKQELKGVKGQDRYSIKQIYHSKRSFGEELLEE